MAAPPSLVQGPPSEGEFVRALRDHALTAVQIPEEAGVPELSQEPVAGLTPAELEARTGLSRPSVAGLLKRFQPILLGQDLEGAATSRGEQARRWAIDPAVGVVVAVEIGRRDTPLVATSDLYGRIQRIEPVDAAETADETVDRIVERMTALLGDRPHTDVVGVGVSLAAPVSAAKGVIPAVPPAIDGPAPDSPWAEWQLINVREHLRSRLGWGSTPFRLDNDANLSALAEHTWGEAGHAPLADLPSYTNVVYMEWSRGIGAGLILGGELYRGQGVAGEIGHTVVAEGPRCTRCGNLGCLEAVAGWDAVVERLPGFGDKRHLDEEDLRAALQLAREEPAAAAEFEQAARVVGQVLGPTIHLLNPQLVIVGGDVARLGYDVVKAPLLKSLMRHTMRPALADATIVRGMRLQHAALRGAIALVLRDDSAALLAFLQRRLR
jgi:predicted NBD/HSP70 family sugar kinase